MQNPIPLRFLLVPRRNDTGDLSYRTTVRDLLENTEEAEDKAAVQAALSVNEEKEGKAMIGEPGRV